MQVELDLLSICMPARDMTNSRQVLAALGILAVPKKRLVVRLRRPGPGALGAACERFRGLCESPEEQKCNENARNSKGRIFRISLEPGLSTGHGKRGRAAVGGCVCVCAGVCVCICV